MHTRALRRSLHFRRLLLNTLFSFYCYCPNAASIHFTLNFLFWIFCAPSKCGTKSRIVDFRSHNELGRINFKNWFFFCYIPYAFAGHPFDFERRYDLTVEKKLFYGTSVHSLCWPKMPTTPYTTWMCCVRCWYMVSCTPFCRAPQQSTAASRIHALALTSCHQHDIDFALRGRVVVCSTQIISAIRWAIYGTERKG